MAILISIFLWASLGTVSYRIGLTRIRQGASDLMGLIFDAATLPLDAVWGLRRPLFWTAVISSLLSTALITTGLNLKNQLLVALGGISFGLFLAFLWLLARALTAYLNFLADIAASAVTKVGKLLYDALVRLLEALHVAQPGTLPTAGQPVAPAQQGIAQSLVNLQQLLSNINSWFGFATAVWFALLTYLTMAPYWDTFVTLPVLTLIILTITFFGMHFGLFGTSRISKRVYHGLVLVFWVYLAASFFSIVAARSNALYNSLPQSGQAVARYLGAYRDAAATKTARAAGTLEVDANMTLVEVMKDTFLYGFSTPGLPPTPSSQLLKGTMLALPNPQQAPMTVGAEPMYEVIVQNSEGDFVNSVNRGWVAARKVRLTEPIEPAPPTGSWLPRLDSFEWLLLFVGIGLVAAILLPQILPGKTASLTQSHP